MLIKSEYSLDALLKAKNIKFNCYIFPNLYTYELDGTTPVQTIYNLRRLISETTLSISEFSVIVLTVKINFDMFMDQIDKALEKQVGLTSNDLPDYDWMAEFESNVEPQESVSEFLLTLEEY